MRRTAFAFGVALLFAAAIALTASDAAPKRPKGKRPPVAAPVPRADTTARKGTAVPAPARARVDTGRTTIAPYPVPDDTSPDAALRGRLLNVPKPGMTTIAPLPAPVPRTPIGEQPRTSANTGAPPKWGDFVHVTELPEPIVRVPPHYPDEALAKGIQGTVLVRALVLEDGTVAEAHAMATLPYLDAAAEASLLRWRFKPAMDGPNPVAVWVRIPVKFTLP